MTRALATLAARASFRSARARHPVTLLVVAALLTACGGSSQSGNAFTYLTVDGFSLSGGTSTATVNSSSNPGTTTTACVTLRNNLKNPTLTGPNTLDNVTIQSYIVTLTRTDGGSLPGPFTFGAAVLVPAGTVTEGVVAGNTATFPVIVVPAGAKANPGVVATAELTFRGRDGRGDSVETEGAVTVVFVSGDEPTVSCSTTTTP